MRRLKAIWNILTCDNYFLATWHETTVDQDTQKTDEIRYIHPKCSQYFVDYIKTYIDAKYKDWPTFK